MKNVSLLTTVTRALFPEKCIACARILAESQLFCPNCLQSVDCVGDSVCSICGRPLFRVEQAQVCYRCLKQRPPFSCCRALFLYGGAVKSAMVRLKYAGATQIAKPLARRLVKELGNAIPSLPDLVTSVPLHPVRQASRGYNQSALLARYVAQRLKLPYHRCLKRIDFRTSQGGLTFAQRHENVKHAFQAINEELFVAKNVLLIDDVMASGATAKACSRQLLKHGAKDVVVWVVATTA